MTTYQEALAKAAKLLRLAKSDNPNEAALAASRAQEIIDRWKLDVSGIGVDGALELGSEEPINNFSHDPLDAVAARWKDQLAITLAKINQAQVYRADGGLCLIGRPSDVQTIRYLYTWLCREVERLAARDCAGCGRTYWNNFRIGVVDTVAKKLRLQADETLAAVRQEAAVEAATMGGNTMALVLVNNAIVKMEKKALDVDLWAKKNMKLCACRRSKASSDPGARARGQVAGHEVNMGARAALAA